MGYKPRVYDHPTHDQGRLYEPENTPVIPDDAVFTVEILAWRPVHRGALIGKVDACLGGILELFDSPIMVGQDGRPWVGLPGRQVIDRSGRVTISATGKAVFEPCVKWRTREVRDRWSRAVLIALVQQHGENCLTPPPAGR
jgi:hypothetical protein